MCAHTHIIYIRVDLKMPGFALFFISTHSVGSELQILMTAPAGRRSLLCISLLVNRALFCTYVFSLVLLKSGRHYGRRVWIETFRKLEIRARKYWNLQLQRISIRASTFGGVLCLTICMELMFHVEQIISQLVNKFSLSCNPKVCYCEPTTDRQSEPNEYSQNLLGPF
jgi:hypothetical protein